MNSGNYDLNSAHQKCGKNHLSEKIPNQADKIISQVESLDGSHPTPNDLIEIDILDLCGDDITLNLRNKNCHNSAITPPNDLFTPPNTKTAIEQELTDVNETLGGILDEGGEGMKFIQSSFPHDPFIQLNSRVVCPTYIGVIYPNSIISGDFEPNGN